MSVLSISAPASAYLGENVSIEVLVKNEGDYLENFTLTLSSDLDGENGQIYETDRCGWYEA